MFTEKMIVGAVMLIWRVMRGLGLLAIGGGGRKQSTLGALQMPGAYWMPPRRRGFGDALTWTTVLALLGIGVPLSTTDPVFTAEVTQDFHRLMQLADRIASQFAS